MSTITSISEWLDYENTRYCLPPARHDNPLEIHSEAPMRYRPGAPTYDLPLYRVDARLCQIFKSRSPNPEIEDYYFPKTDVLFPVHPVNLESREILHITEITQKYDCSITVNPTSSTRTVFVLERHLPIHCIKPHTDLHITGRRRHMEVRKVAHAIAITKIFESCSVFSENKKIGFFPESLGAIYGEGSTNDWGFVVREMRSKPHLEVPYTMIPLNALYTPSNRATGEPPLLVEIIQNSKSSPIEFILEEIIQPLIAGWIDIYLETGVLLEPHGQNVIVEMDPDRNKILHFSHRDFECDINGDILQSFLVEKGMHIEGLNPQDIFSGQGSASAPKGLQISIIFDNSMKVPLDALAELGSRYFDIEPNLIRARCHAFLKKNFPKLLRDHFPPDGSAYYFHKTSEGESIASRPPTWREANMHL